MKTIKLAVVLFLLSAISSVGKTFDWAVEYKKIDNLVKIGDYAGALKYNKAFVTNLGKQFGGDTYLIALAKFQESRIHNGLGNFTPYESALTEGFRITSKFKNDNIDYYVLATTEAAQAYCDFGNYKKADLLIDQLKPLIEKISDNEVAAKVHYLQSQILFGQSYYLECLASLKTVQADRYAQIVNTVQVRDPKTGKLKIRKLSSKEIAERKRNYAELLNLYVDVFIANGAFQSADSILQTNTYWIQQQLGNTDFAMVKNLYQQGLVNDEKQDLKKAYNSYKSAYELLPKSKGLKYKANAPTAGMISEKTILAAKKVIKYKEAANIQIKYTATWKRFYPKKNVHRINIDLLEVQREMIEEDYAKAQEILQDLIEKDSNIPLTHAARIRVLKLMSIIHKNNDAYDDMDKDLTEILRIKKELVGDETPSYHLSMLDLADYYVLYTGKLKQAEEIYKKSLEGIVSKEIDHRSRDYINNLYNQAKLYEITDRFSLAQRILVTARDDIKARFGENSVLFALAKSRLAALDIEVGKYAEAEKTLKSVSEMMEALSEHVDNKVEHAEVLETYALLQIIQGNYAEASKLLAKANKLIRVATSSAQQKVSVANEEMIYLNIYTGKYQGTEQLLKEAIALREKKFGLKSRTLINAYDQLGELYLITGEFTEAEKSVQRALKISLSIFGDSSLRYSESLRLLEKTYSAIGDYEKAEEAIKKVLDIQVKKYGKTNFHVAQSLNQLALIRFYNKGSKSEIEDNFQESLKIIKNTLGDKNPEYAEVLKNLALYYIETSKYTDAAPLLNTAFNIYIEKFGENNIHTAEILLLQGNLSYLRTKYSEARNKYTEAKTIYAKVFDSEHPNYVKALSLVGKMNYILGDYKLAVKNFDETTTNYLSFIKRFFPSLSEREKTKYWNLIKNDFEFYNSLAIKMQRDNPSLVGNMYNFALNTKAILLNSSIKVRERILSSKDQNLIHKYEEFVAKKEFMASAISMSNDERRAEGIDMKTIEKDIEVLEKDLSSSSELFVSDYEKSTVYTWEKVKENLKENEVAVELVRFRKFGTSFSDSIYYAALIVSAETKGQPQLVLLENGKEMETKYMKYYRNTIKQKLEDQLTYEQFWKPLKKYIKDNAVVYLSSEGVYNQVNIETMIAPDGSTVIDKNEIILISSTRDLMKKKQVAKSKKDVVEKNYVALFGNPSYYASDVKVSSDAVDRAIGLNEKVSQLPGAEKEVKEIYNLLKSSNWLPKLYLQNNAEEDSVKKLKNPKVFHIATHGFFMEDAVDEDELGGGLNENKLYRNPLLRSGLLLRNGGALMSSENVYDFNSDNGILTAYEAMNLNFDKTDLVVLSACETGLGEVSLGEGVYGLQRSFLVAGSQSIIMSLFKVNDEVTQELMLSFYKKWIATGDRRKSFLAAKKEIKAKYKDPIFWGSFIMIGMN